MNPHKDIPVDTPCSACFHPLYLHHPLAEKGYIDCKEFVCSTVSGGAPEPLHSGAGEVLGEKLKFSDPPHQGVRTDQESFQDANHIRQSLLRVRKLEREVAKERALTVCALLLIPAGFFAGLVIATIVWTWNHRPEAPLALAILSWLCFSYWGALSLLTTRTARDISEKLERIAGSGLWR